MYFGALLILFFHNAMNIRGHDEGLSREQEMVHLGWLHLVLTFPGFGLDLLSVIPHLCSREDLSAHSLAAHIETNQQLPVDETYFVSSCLVCKRKENWAGWGAVNCSQVDRWCRRHMDVCFLWRVQCWACSIDSTGDVWGTVLGRWCRQHRGCLWSVESTMVTETVQLSHCELNCLRVNVTWTVHCYPEFLEPALKEVRSNRWVD